MRNEGVYFILARGLDYIKIGYSRHVRNRLSRLQTASPVPLALLGVADGDRALETRLHERFAAYRMSGEWFEYSEELKEYIPDIWGHSQMSANTVAFLRFMRAMSEGAFREAIANIASESGRTETAIYDEFQKLST